MSGWAASAVWLGRPAGDEREGVPGQGRGETKAVLKAGTGARFLSRPADLVL